VHVAGDKMLVHYSGKKPHYVEPTTGEVVEVELFVAVPALGATRTLHGRRGGRRRKARTGRCG
jgi:transposase